MAVCVSNVQAQDSVRLNEGYSNVFGGREVKVQIAASSKENKRRLIRWSHMANDRTLSNGEVDVDFRVNQSQSLSVKLRIPSVKPGVIFGTKLLASIGDPQQSDVLAKTEAPIWIFHEDPFYGHGEWLKSLKIAVYDPDGATVEFLTEAGVPFDRIRNLAALEKFEQCTLIVGEGASLKRNQSLPKVVEQLAAKGARILWLAPAATGRFGVSTDGNKVSPESLSFHRNGIITRLDKRLDAHRWLTDIDPVIRHFSHRSFRNRLVLEFSDEPTGWPWHNVSYENGGELVYCGFGIVKHWESSPTPRFLLLRILQHLNKTSDGEPSRQENR
ncbi:MAG: hypothetical protein CMJ78_04840 [Planctomycetaceae bacterium]|nr:hypothetical protein [Planctomycetaceae bacterium]